MRFTRAGGGQWPEWDRYLELHGERAYHLGNVCGTCEYLFQRLDGANSSVAVAELVVELASGLTSLTGPLLDTLATLLPGGSYEAVLFTVTPHLIRPGGPGDYFADEQVATWGVDSFWGLPHDPRTEYYRLGHTPLGGGRVLYEFLIPMYPHNWLHEEGLQRYARAPLSDRLPTAVAIGLLDVKGPADWGGQEAPAVQEHWCLSHFLLDGHHKTYAAAVEGQSLTLLSFIAAAQGISAPGQLEEALSAFSAVDA